MKIDVNLLKEKAIEAALRGKWLKAIKLNKKIITQEPENLAAHLRLGFAYLQTNELKKAKETYIKALKIEPINQIAQSNLEKIRILQKKHRSILNTPTDNGKKTRLFLTPDLFVKTPGKTKVVSLIKLGQIATLTRLKVGERLFLKIKKRRIEIRTGNDEYIGALPDDLSKRLILFIKGKTKYSCYIKEVSQKNVVVFIKEEKKPKKLSRYLSFPEDLHNNLNKIVADVEKDREETEKEEEEEETEEGPLDIEQLAEEVQEKEVYPETPLEDDSELEE